MQEIIDKNITYRRTECHTTEAVRIFNERGMTDKVKLLETSGSIYTYYYSLEDTIEILRWAVASHSQQAKS